MREPLNQALFKGLATFVAALCMAPVLGIAAGYRNGMLGQAVFMGALAASAPLALIVTLVSFRRSKRLRRPVDGLCVDCGYDLAGNVSGRCPECGRPTDASWN